MNSPYFSSVAPLFFVSFFPHFASGDPLPRSPLPLAVVIFTGNTLWCVLLAMADVEKDLPPAEALYAFDIFGKGKVEVGAGGLAPRSYLFSIRILTVEAEPVFSR